MVLTVHLPVDPTLESLESIPKRHPPPLKPVGPSFWSYFASSSPKKTENRHFNTLGKWGSIKNDPIASDSFIQGLFQVSKQKPFLVGLLLWVHRNQITVGCKELAGHLKSRHLFTQTVVLHVQVLSLWALVRDHFGYWKNHRLFLISGCQNHHTCGLWMTLVCRMMGEEGNLVWGFKGAQGGLPPGRKGGRPCRVVLTRPVLITFSSGFLRNALPAQQWPSLLTPLEFYPESNHWEHYKVSYSSVKTV